MRQMGGQDGDNGCHHNCRDGEFIVEDVDTTIKLKGGKIGHIGTCNKGYVQSW